MSMLRPQLDSHVQSPSQTVQQYPWGVRVSLFLAVGAQPTSPALGISTCCSQAIELQQAEQVTGAQTLSIWQGQALCVLSSVLQRAHAAVLTGMPLWSHPGQHRAWVLEMSSCLWWALP